MRHSTSAAGKGSARRWAIEGLVTAPAFRLFLAAAAALGVAPEEALVLEDSENGLRAATAAGIPCAIVTNPVTTGGSFDGAVLEAECFTDARVQALL